MLPDRPDCVNEQGGSGGHSVRECVISGVWFVFLGVRLGDSPVQVPSLGEVMPVRIAVRPGDGALWDGVFRANL